MSFTFIPAESFAEAASRIYALSGQRVDHKRGPKRVLVALARALELDVDLVRTNGFLARIIAEALCVRLPDGSLTTTDQVTLEGVNALLRGAAEVFADRRPVPVKGGAADASVAWAHPARDKFEAVNRISDLTGSGPEIIGPGSKEQKSVLINLASALFPDVSTKLNKAALGKALADRLGVPWTDDCTSTGYSITLPGLNNILGGAERLLGSPGHGSSAFASPADEAAALIAVLEGALPSRWDGRDCVEEMQEEGYRNWRQTEWPGWFFEHRGLVALNDAFPMPEIGGTQRLFGSTPFDYALGWVWDLKAHTQRKRHRPSGATQKNSATLLLNDADAARACIAQQGLGFLVLSGDAYLDDDHTFDDWHRSFTRSAGSESRRPNGGTSRRRKAAFHLGGIEAFRLDDAASLDAALAAGAVVVAPQGRQQVRAGEVEGALRNDKLQLNTAKADDLVVAWGGWDAVDGILLGPG